MHVFHKLPFFYARKIYVGTHVKITQQWKSTLNASVNSSCALWSVPAVPGVGAFANFVLPEGRAFAKPGAFPELLIRKRFPMGKRSSGYNTCKKKTNQLV